MCSACFPQLVLPADASLPSTGSSEASSPASTVLSKHCDILPPSRRASFPSLGDTWAALVICAPCQTSAADKAWSWSPGVSSRDSPRRRQDLPSSWGTSIIRLHMFQSDAGGTARTRPFTVQQRGPWSSKGKGSHDWVFRRSIAWPSDSLSTLRDADYSNTTQDSLPVAGQALLDGLSTRMVPLKGFRVVDYISSSSPKLLGAMGVSCVIKARTVRDTGQ